MKVAGLSGGRRGGHQVRVHSGGGARTPMVILRSENGRAPPGACFALRCLRDAAIPALPRWRSCRSWTTPSLSRSSRRGHQNGACSAPPARADSTSTRPSQRRCVSSHIPTGIVVELPERAQRSSRTRRHVYEDAGRRSCMQIKGARASGQASSDIKGVQERHRLGQPDPQLMYSCPIRWSKDQPHRL